MQAPQERSENPWGQEASSSPDHDRGAALRTNEDEQLAELADLAQLMAEEAQAAGSRDQAGRAAETQHRHARGGARIVRGGPTRAKHTCPAADPQCMVAREPQRTS